METIHPLWVATALCLAVGSIAGLLGGLLGIGGGLIIVPALVWVYGSLNFPASQVMQFAIATSLASILFTGLSAVRAHHQRGAVRWDLVKWLAPSLIVGAFTGSQIAHAISGQLLMKMFGVFAILLALQLLFAKNTEGMAAVGSPYQPTRLVHSVTGFIIGTASALFGIGGGSLTVPYLRAIGIQMRQAVASSSACGMPIALAGTVGFVFAGWAHEDLPPGSLGYVHFPSLAALVAASVPMAIVGARLAHRLPALHLRRVFALTLLLVATKFLYPT